MSIDSLVQTRVILFRMQNMLKPVLIMYSVPTDLIVIRQPDGRLSTRSYTHEVVFQGTDYSDIEQYIQSVIPFIVPGLYVIVEHINSYQNIHTNTTVYKTPGTNGGYDYADLFAT